MKKRYNNRYTRRKRLKNNNNVSVRRYPDEDIESLIDRFNARLKKHGKSTYFPQDTRQKGGFVRFYEGR